MFFSCCNSDCHCFFFTGRISYVLYLWHWPVIFAFTRLGLTSAAWMGAAIGLSLVLATATHYVVENPLRRVAWPPKKTFIVHGEPNASDALRLRITDKLGWDCVIPQMMERHEL